MMAWPVYWADDGSCHVVRWRAHNFDTIHHKDRYNDGDECDGKNKSCNLTSQYLATKGGHLITSNGYRTE